LGVSILQFIFSEFFFKQQQHRELKNLLQETKINIEVKNRLDSCANVAIVSNKII
jgi:hypothetical protein